MSENILIRAKVKLVNVTGDTSSRYVGVSYDSMSYTIWDWPIRVIAVPASHTGQYIIDYTTSLHYGYHWIYIGVGPKGINSTWKLKAEVYRVDTGAKLFEKEQTFDLSGAPSTDTGVIQNLGYFYVAIGEPPPTTNYRLNYQVGTGGSLRIVAGTNDWTVTGSGYKEILENSAVYLEAKPSAGYRLDYIQWDSIKEYTQSVSLMMTKDYTVKVYFAVVETPPSGYYNLSFNVGTGGKITINGVEKTGSGSLTFSSGTSITIKVIPDTGYNIKTFKVNGTTISGKNEYTFTISSNKSVTVEFEKKEEGGGGIDVGKLMNDMMNAMMPIMGMMMMMSMMTGMIQSIMASMAV